MGEHFFHVTVWSSRLRGSRGVALNASYISRLPAPRWEKGWRTDSKPCKLFGSQRVAEYRAAAFSVEKAKKFMENRAHVNRPFLPFSGF